MTCSMLAATLCTSLTAPVYLPADKYELPAIATFAARYMKLPEHLVHAVIQQESKYNPNATGAAGEIGLMQMKCSTARLLSFTGECKELYRPDLNLFYGLRYLARAYELCGGYGDPPAPNASTCAAVRYNKGIRTKNLKLNPYAYAVQQKIKEQDPLSVNPNAAAARAR